MTGFSGYWLAHQSSSTPAVIVFYDVSILIRLGLCCAGPGFCTGVLYWTGWRCRGTSGDLQKLKLDHNEPMTFEAEMSDTVGSLRQRLQHLDMCATVEMIAQRGIYQFPDTVHP